MPSPLPLPPPLDLIERGKRRERLLIRAFAGRRRCGAAFGFGDVEGVAGALLAGLVHFRQAVAVRFAAFAAAAFDVWGFFLEADALVVEAEEHQCLVRGHAGDRRGIIVAPGVVAIAGGEGGLHQRHFDALIACFQRELHFAGEGGALAAAGVEGGVAEAGGGGGEADVGGGAERGEERLFGGAIERATGEGAQLHPARRSADRAGLAGVGLWFGCVEVRMGDDERRVPFGGEGGVAGAAFEHGRAVDVEAARCLACVAGAAERGEEGGVFLGLTAVEGAGSGHLTVFRNEIQHCKGGAGGCSLSPLAGRGSGRGGLGCGIFLPDCPSPGLALLGHPLP